jgi:hypothetical protein
MITSIGLSSAQKANLRMAKPIEIFVLKLQRNYYKKKTQKKSQEKQARSSNKRNKSKRQTEKKAQHGIFKKRTVYKNTSLRHSAILTLSVARTTQTNISFFLVPSILQIIK